MALLRAKLARKIFIELQFSQGKRLQDFADILFVPSGACKQSGRAWHDAAVVLRSTLQPEKIFFSELNFLINYIAVTQTYFSGIALPKIVFGIPKYPVLSSLAPICPRSGLDQDKKRGQRAPFSSP